MVYAPMVMPEVITGLSLLLFFVAIDLDRGFWTMTLAHTTLTMCFVTVVVQARLMTFDRSLEEAAMDLGAPPLRTFFSVTLPLIAPSIVAGFLLAFTLSLDDLVIASFNTGPGATTLPIRIYSQVRLGLSPEVNAASAILIGIVALGVTAATLLSKRSSLRESQRRSLSDGLRALAVGGNALRRKEGLRRARALDERANLRRDGDIVPAARHVEDEGMGSGPPAHRPPKHPP